MENRSVTREDVIELVKRLPGDKLAVAYDFLAFAQARTGDDWLNDDEDPADAIRIAAEDAPWEQARAPAFVAESQAAYSPLCWPRLRPARRSRCLTKRASSSPTRSTTNTTRGSGYTVPGRGTGRPAR